MSVQISKAASLPVQTAYMPVQLPDGTIVPAVRTGTYQVDNVTGVADLVVGSVYYAHPDTGVKLIGAVATLPASVAAVQPVRQWFFSGGRAPIYIDGGLFFNADDSPFEAAIADYQVGGTTTTINNYGAPIVSQVWIKVNTRVGFRYIALTRTQTNTVDNSANVVTYREGDTLVTLPVGAEVLTVLPEPMYRKTFETISGEATNAPPTEYPISGFSVVWDVPLPTVNNLVRSTVMIDGLEPQISNGDGVQSEAPYGTVEPPSILTGGRARADIVYRQRVSPLFAVMADLDATPTETFDATSSVEASFEM